MAIGRRGAFSPRGAGRGRVGLALRKVRRDDAEPLRSIMNGCVSDADSFHGKCDPWSTRWAEICTRRHPETVVITRAGVPVAFQEIPSIRSAIEPPAADASAEERRKYELRDQSRRVFYLQAAGVRADVLGSEEAVRMFRRVLYYGFKRARDLGYEQVECFVPCQQHPKMARAWTDYPGCELVMRSRATRPAAATPTSCAGVWTTPSKHSPWREPTMKPSFSAEASPTSPLRSEIYPRVGAGHGGVAPPTRRKAVETAIESPPPQSSPSRGRRSEAFPPCGGRFGWGESDDREAHQSDPFAQ
jgi:hypothetical protein